LKILNNRFINVILLIITFITTTLAGVMWRGLYSPPFTLSQIASGLEYSFAILFIILSHEFGHYFASKIHNVDSTLPYLIPIPPYLFGINFGTMGAIIKTKSQITNRKALFDIGAWGPFAGFVATFIVLFYGFYTLPGKEYILKIHPDYFENFKKYDFNLTFGDNLLFIIFRKIFYFKEFIPPMNEIYHYPFLCAGWFGLFITSMNLIPVGQLDGGHITYAVLGRKRHLIISKLLIFLLFLIGLNSLFFQNFGSEVWLFWAIILKFVLKESHPPIWIYEDKISNFRIFLSILLLIIFILSFTPSAIYF